MTMKRDRVKCTTTTCADCDKKLLICCCECKNDANEAKFIVDFENIQCNPEHKELFMKLFMKHD